MMGYVIIHIGVVGKTHILQYCIMGQSISTQLYNMKIYVRCFWSFMIVSPPALLINFGCGA